MSFCTNCGADVTAEMEFCRACGAKLSDVCNDNHSSRDEFEDYDEPVSGSAHVSSKPKSNLSKILIYIALLLLSALIIGFMIKSFSNNSVTLSASSNTGDKPILIPMGNDNKNSLLGSRWRGTIDISKTKGSANELLRDGVIVVYAIIDSDEDNRPYFEIYHADDDSLILSMYVKLFDDYFKADIGENDAWYFDIYLYESEENIFTFIIEDGEIYNSYKYDSGFQSCTLKLNLKME